MSQRINRRIFLRGLGGACVAAPLLSSLMDRGAKAQPVAPPTRLIAMYTHYGCITNRFFPVKSHGPLAASDLDATTLAPLVPYLGKLLIPRGIRSMNEWTSKLERGQGNDPHLQACGSYFTCHPVTPNSDDPFSFLPATRLEAMPTGPSLDHVIAKQLSPRGIPLFMRVGNRSENSPTAVSYAAAETPYPGFGTPSEAFSSLTGLFKTGEPLSADSYAAARGKSIIDLVRNDLDTLERKDMSRADKSKLEAWKSLLDETGAVLTSPHCNIDVARALGATAMTVDSASSAASNDDPLMVRITESLDGADVYSAVAALAAVCNANPVIFLKYPGTYVFKGLGLTYDSHLLSLRKVDASHIGGCSPGVIDMLLAIDRYHSQKFAKLLSLLDQVPEADGTTVLDASAAVWFQEMSDGNAHNLNNLPIIQAGGAGGYFKTGWTVNVADGSADLSRGNSEAVCTEGVPGPSSGTDPNLANAPINKYFCNLMNALGVKAGADGFPARGGSEEVTRYGRYDRTEDFVHGGTVPPTIHSPGEFSALRASA